MKQYKAVIIRNGPINEVYVKPLFKGKVYIIHKLVTEASNDFGCCTYVITHIESGTQVIALSNFNKAKELCMELNDKYPYSLQTLQVILQEMKDKLIRWTEENDIKNFSLSGYNYKV